MDPAALKAAAAKCLAEGNKGRVSDAWVQTVMNSMCSGQLPKASAPNAPAPGSAGTVAAPPAAGEVHYDQYGRPYVYNSNGTSTPLWTTGSNIGFNNRYTPPSYLAPPIDATFNADYMAQAQQTFEVTQEVPTGPGSLEGPPNPGGNIGIGTGNSSSGNGGPGTSGGSLASCGASHHGWWYSSKTTLWYHDEGSCLAASGNETGLCSQCP